VTYLRRASVVSWGSRAPSWDAARLAQLPPDAPLAVIVASNCRDHSNRSARFRALRSALGGRAEHLGRCGDVPWPSCGGKACSKHGALRRYPFYLAWENAHERDYVSEKAFDGLEAGVVPVYLGAPNGPDFFPPKAAVFAADFGHDMARLGAHLLWLVERPQRYLDLFSWKGRPLPEAYARRWGALVLVRPACRLCRWLYWRRHAEAGNVSWDHATQTLRLARGAR